MRILEGISSSELAYTLLSQSPRPTACRRVIVVPDDDHAVMFARDLEALGVDSYDIGLFCGDDHLPDQEASPDVLAMFGRLGLRRQLIFGAAPSFIVASAPALLGKWMPETTFLRATQVWRAGDHIERQRLIAQLMLCGYQAVPQVEDEGTFAIRGGVVDIFVPEMPRPMRLDFFGDTLEHLKTFDPATQRTFETLQQVVVGPIRDVIFDDNTVAHAVARIAALEEEYPLPSRYMRTLREDISQRSYFLGVTALAPAFYGSYESVLDTLLTSAAGVVDAVLFQSDLIASALHDYASRAQAEHVRAKERHQAVLPMDAHLLSPESVLDRLNACASLSTVQLALERDHTPASAQFSRWDDLTREMTRRREDVTCGEILDPLVETLQQCGRREHSLMLACASRGGAERLRELLLARKVDVPILPRPNLVRGVIGIVVSPLSRGFMDKQSGIGFICESEMFGTHKTIVRKQRHKNAAQGLSTLADVQKGELIIHIDHGIGRYLGLQRLVVNGVDGDFVHIEYADNDKLYVPVYRIGVLKQYRGPSVGVRLDKLGGSQWERTKQRVKDHVMALAHTLLATQAQRKVKKGFRLPPPDAHFKAFEATFPYDETPDQLAAIHAVLHDLTQDTPMDRLVCGDVGFGKTEVAVRAAFLAVLGGKQVAVLVPTTVLAEQHGMTFTERLQAQGVRVAVLSRFRSAAETQEIIRGVRDGTIDIVIGTHRLLSSDVVFRDLALLVIDEEHRFGVTHKERIKTWRSQVHVLTLSATPIPRTLHMATSGMRDLSLITTPPVERLAIRTEVSRFDETLIQEAIRRELKRGGQVFVVHNRIESIDGMADMIRQLVPEARVAIGHGQMTAERLEQIMVDFVRRAYHVLVCTAIIESGIDIPNANTLIVNRADMFGLAQLYQLRGRIGRGHDRAYAYLLVPRGERITAEATERLGLLKRFSELGSGFQIATHDLELRGAGDLLGADQTGQIAAVGFELYTELLHEAVEHAKGHGGQHALEPDIKLPVSAVLPESYVPDPARRMAWYQQMAYATTEEQIRGVRDEIEDVYGQAPVEVAHLTEVMLIRHGLQRLGASHLSAQRDGDVIKIGVAFVAEGAVDRADLVLRCQQQPGTYRMLPSGRLAISIAEPHGSNDMALLAAVRRTLADLKITASRSPWA